MRKILLLNALLLGFINLNAQSTFNRAYHNKNEKSNPWLVQIAGQYYFSSNEDNSGTWLYKHSPNGSLLFKTNVLTDFIPEVGYKTYDNMLLLVGRPRFCDVFPSTQPNFIAKIDSSGNSVFTSTFSVIQFDNPKASIQYPDSSYFCFTDSLMFKFSKNGQFVSKTNLGLTKISAALLLQDNSILLSAKQAGIISLIAVSSSGATLSTKPFPVLISKLEFYEGQKVLGLGLDSNLYKISPNCGPLGNSNFANGLKVNGFECVNDTIYSIFTSGNVLSSYAVCDTSFGIISLTNTTTKKISQSAICVNGTKVAILSDGISKSSISWLGEHYFVSLNAIDKTGSNNFTNDIELRAIYPDSSFAYSGFSGAAFLRAKAKIKNKGPNVIKKFKLNCFMYPHSSCGVEYYQQEFDQLSLLPGDSLVVTTNGFVEKEWLTLTPPTATVQYCFYTTVPNGETDKTFEDNEKCDVFSLAVTGLNELNGLENARIFPNPFQNKVSIEADVEIKKLQLFNCMGICVEQQILNDKNILLDNAELSPGIYFLKLETEKGTAIRKIIKE